MVCSCGSLLSFSAFSNGEIGVCALSKASRLVLQRSLNQAVLATTAQQTFNVQTQQTNKDRVLSIGKFNYNKIVIPTIPQLCIYMYITTVLILTVSFCHSYLDFLNLTLLSILTYTIQCVYMGTIDWSLCES